MGKDKLHIFFLKMEFGWKNVIIYLCWFLTQKTPCELGPSFCCTYAEALSKIKSFCQRPSHHNSAIQCLNCAEETHLFFQ